MYPFYDEDPNAICCSSLENAYEKDYKQDFGLQNEGSKKDFLEMVTFTTRKAPSVYFLHFFS